MPITANDLTFKADFQISTSPKQINIYDTTPYQSLYNIANASVTGYITVTGPGGISVPIANGGNPDFDGSVPGGVTNQGLINLYTIALPLLPDGSVVPGTYVASITTFIAGVTPINGWTTVVNFTYNFAAPTINIVQTVDCLTPRFTSTDATNYVVNGVAPISIVRSHSVFFPTTPPNAPQNVNAPVITLGSGQFFQGLQQSVLTSVVTYDFGNNNIVTVTLTGTKTVAVDCTYFCTIYCCLRSLNNNIKKYQGVNDVLAQQYQETFTQVMSLVELATLAYSCGKSNDVAGYTAQIQALADCTDDCSCQDGTPSPVTGLGGGGSGVNVTISQCPNNSIQVTQSGVSPNINYTLCLDPTLLNKILAQYNTVVAAGAGISVSSVSSGGTTTYTVANTYTPENRLAFQCQIAYNPGSPGSSVLTLSKSQVTGTLLQTPTTAVNTNYTPLSAQFPFTNNRFSISGFFILPPVANNFKVLATMVGIGPGKIFVNSGIVPQVLSSSTTNNGTITFRLIDTFANNIPADNVFISGSNIVINFEIITY